MQSQYGTDKEAILQALNVQRYYEEELPDICFKDGKEWSENISSPFREDKNPSFGVNKITGGYNDLGGESGSIFDFHMKKYGVDFPTALKQLAERAGIQTEPPYLVREYNINESPIPTTPAKDANAFEPKAVLESLNGTANNLSLPPGIFETWGKGAVSKPYVAHWAYHCLEGNVIGYAVRYQNEGERDKDVVPFFKKKDPPFGIKDQTPRWKVGAAPVPRPMYNLHFLGKDGAQDETPKPILITAEGEKACDAAHELIGDHYICMTWPGGSKAVGRADWTSVRDRHVIVWPDADTPGLKSAHAVKIKCLKAGAKSCRIVTPPSDVIEGWDLADAQAEGWTGEKVLEHIASSKEPIKENTVQGILAWVESEGDSDIIIDTWTAKTNGLKPREIEIVKEVVQKKTGCKKSILNSQHNDQKREWAQITKKKTQKQRSRDRAKKGITEIIYDEIETGKCCHAVSMVLRNSKNGRVYRHSGNLIKIVDAPPTSVRMVQKLADQGQKYPAMPVIAHLTPETLTHEIEQVAVCQVSEDKEDENAERHDIPWPRTILRGVLALSEYHEHNLTGIIEHPYVDFNFKPVMTPGFDEATGLYKCYQGEFTKIFPDATEALIYLIDDVFDDFPFASDLDRLAAAACLLTGMQRKIITDGSGCPGFLFTAPTQGSGKTTLGQTISYSLYNRPAAASTFAEDDTEMAKHLLGILQEGHSCVLFDNLPEGSAVESNEIAKVITSDCYSNRWLGKNKTVTVPSSVLWMFTGNNVSVCGDFNTRILSVELDPKTANPDQLIYKRSNIGEWCEQNREKILSACLQVIMEGAEYKPDGLKPSRFPSWDKFVRYPLYKASSMDVAEIFQKNKTADPKLEGQRAFFETWFEIFGSTPITVRDFLKAAQQSTTEYSRTEKEEILQEALEDIFPGGVPTSKAFGKWLGGMKNRFFGDYRLESEGKVTSREQKGSALYRVRQDVGL